MGLLLRCLSVGGEHASLVLALHSGQWPETLMLRLSWMSRWSISVHNNWDGVGIYLPVSDNQGFRPLPHLGIKNGIEEMISRAKKALMVLISIGEARVTFNWRLCMHGTVKESGTA
jgi:hypothetical protein